jgi:hypothetical protein
MLLCSLHPNPHPSKKEKKNEKISNSSIRHWHHHSNLCLAGSGSWRRRILIIDPTIPFYRKMKKKHRFPDLCFFMGHHCDHAEGVSWEQESARISGAAGLTPIGRFLISIEIYIM